MDNDGFKIKTVRAKKENIPENQHSLIVILGAPESANDNLPYLRREEKLIQNAIQNETPTPGICLGSQLMTKALGGKVYRGPITEIGFYSDVKVANHSKLFEGCSNPTTVFHWHRDTYYCLLVLNIWHLLQTLKTKPFNMAAVLVYNFIWKFLKKW